MNNNLLSKNFFAISFTGTGELISFTGFDTEDEASHYVDFLRGVFPIAILTDKATLGEVIRIGLLAVNQLNQLIMSQSKINSN